MMDEFIPPRLETAARPSQGQPLPWGPGLQLASRFQGGAPSCQWDPVVLPCTFYKSRLGLPAYVWESHWPGLSAQGRLALTFLKGNTNMVCKCSHLGKDPLLFPKN